jgi:hypothetical protein
MRIDLRKLGRAASLLAGLAMLGVALPALAAPAALVTYISGTASRVRDGQSEALHTHSELQEGDQVVTAKGARLELTLADKSVLRLDGGSEVTLKAANFEGEDKKLTAKITFGKIWAKVNSVLGGQSHFDVETQNAVAGVRGTTFRVDAKHDASALVRVYAGAVAVVGTRTPRPSHETGGTRKEVPGPSEVTKQQYEKLLAAMMQVKVASNGELGEPEAFTQKDEAKDSWVAFNQQRDSK